jgi:hypothetical protein
MPQLLFASSDFVRSTNEDLFFSGIALFVALFVYESLTYQLLTLIWGNSDEILKDETRRRKIARSLNEASCMMFMTYLGYATFIELDGMSVFWPGVGVGVERVSFFFH